MDIPAHLAWGYLAVYPPRSTEGATLYDSLAYDVHATITGANIDAITYHGVLAFQEEVEPMADGGTMNIESLTWTKPPQRQ